jgi:AAA ATPase domain
MHCRQCGRTNRSDALFCDTCGARLTGPGEDVGSPPAHRETLGGRKSSLHHQPSHLLDRLAEGMFVGRQEEMKTVQATLADALSGRGRLLMLVGEPGIGKARTAQEMASHASRQGAQVLWGRCYETPGAPPYWPWVQIIRSYVREHALRHAPTHRGRRTPPLMRLRRSRPGPSGAPSCGRDGGRAFRTGAA